MKVCERKSNWSHNRESGSNLGLCHDSGSHATPQWWSLRFRNWLPNKMEKFSPPQGLWLVTEIDLVSEIICFKKFKTIDNVKSNSHFCYYIASSETLKLRGCCASEQSDFVFDSCYQCPAFICGKNWESMSELDLNYPVHPFHCRVRNWCHCVKNTRAPQTLRFEDSDGWLFVLWRWYLLSADHSGRAV
jgi:hypothetical protein